MKLPLPVEKLIPHQKPMCLVDRLVEPGQHLARWDGRDAQGEAQPSGIYFVRLKSGGTRISEKITLLR